MVLAAGPGRRLGPLTSCSPKTLLPLSDQGSILDVVLGNLKAVGIDQIAVVTGHHSGVIEKSVPHLERRHEISLRLIFNPRFAECNNAYSLWCARELFSEGLILVNGDTVHPQLVEERLLAKDSTDVVLAVDRRKPVSVEAMKVRLSWHGSLDLITKDIDVGQAHGEYIGVALIHPEAAGPLTSALERTWRRDPSLYYEDAFQELVHSGTQIDTVVVDGTEWVEVDDSVDLARARDLAGRYLAGAGPARPGPDIRRG
ncbi:MAG TPA: phosphocholine cytidylyltransferase family protein [Solirubrobacteraceae bacterium]|nr:phosphocholine cytidylyltransferase family protein [Solirubrobacteraceae bacterium]